MSESIKIPSPGDGREVISWPDFIDLIDYLLDSSNTLHSFLDIYQPGATAFHNKGFEIR